VWQGGGCQTQHQTPACLAPPHSQYPPAVSMSQISSSSSRALMPMPSGHVCGICGFSTLCVHLHHVRCLHMLHEAVQDRVMKLNRSHPVRQTHSCKLSDLLKCQVLQTKLLKHDHERTEGTSEYIGISLVSSDECLPPRHVSFLLQASPLMHTQIGWSSQLTPDM
jgi:hypothetical protein